MTKEELKQSICTAIEKRASEMMAFGQTIFQEPELGFKENLTSEKVKKAFTALNIPYETGLAITGVKGRLSGNTGTIPHPRTLAVIGELDAIVCRTHPEADELTGAAHCCGHHVQLSDMLGVAMALQDTKAMPYLGGDVVFFAVPAEECIEIDYRQTLKSKGKLHYFGGKEELIYRGAFDDIDAAMQMHVAPTDDPEGNIRIGGPSSGFISKSVEFIGKASHAAAAPHLGINALNAAMLGISAVNALRETFEEKDYVRFHPILTSGGDLVNVVPDYVRMETYVRAASAEALTTYNQKVDHALTHAAEALGATCKITNYPGYLPLYQDQAMTAILEENCNQIFKPEHIILPPQDAASTDMGDVSHLMPVIHPWVGCIKGALHSADFEITDERTAYIKSTQVLAMTLIDLLYDKAQGLETVLEQFKPRMTKEEYIEYMDSIK